MLRHGGPADAEHLERFRREARAVAQLQHPNLVQVYAVGDGPQPYIVLEFIAGGSLADHLKGTPQRPRTAAEFVRTLARAVSHVHEQGIVHRDLKPANVLLQMDSGVRPASAADDPTASGSTILQSAAIRPKITDFGLAKLGGDNLTRTGDTLGTPSYMAP